MSHGVLCFCLLNPESCHQGHLQVLSPVYSRPRSFFPVGLGGRRHAQLGGAGRGRASRRRTCGRGRQLCRGPALAPTPLRGSADSAPGRRGAGGGDPRNIITLFPWPTLKQNRVWEEKLEGEVEQHMERCGVETSGKLLVLLQGN